MAKVTAKASATSVKEVAKVKTSSKSSSSPDPLKKVSEETLKKLQSLNIQQQLQADLEWCIGSYTHDKNPVGLLQVVGRSLTVLKEEQLKKTKGVTAKLISDLEKILKES